MGPRSRWLVVTTHVLIGACGDDSMSLPIPSSAKELTRFSFESAHNPRLSTDVDLAILDTTVSGSIRYGSLVEPLVATFSTSGVRVEIDGIEQVSGVTPNEFLTGPLTYRVLAEDGSYQEYSVEVDSRRAQQALLKPASASSGLFGTAVALSKDGNTLAAAREERVHVFVRSGSTWSEQATLLSSNHEPGDYFGFTVAISDDGSTVAVGAGQEDSAATGIDGNGADNSVNSSGAAYVFVRTGTTWAQQAYIKSFNPDAIDAFGGHGLALSGDGNTLAVGAVGERSGTTDPSDNSVVQAGAAYVFQRTGTTWSQESYLKAPSPEMYGDFGRSIAISRDGTTLAISGAASVGSEILARTYVFARNGSGWDPPAVVHAPVQTQGDAGATIALSADGTTLVIGAEGEDGGGGMLGETDDSKLDSGAAYVFVKTASGWVKQAYLKASNVDAGDEFGTSVSISDDGNTVLVGALYEDSNAVGVDGDGSNNAAENSGAAYTFRRTGGVWTQEAYLKASNTNLGDLFSGLHHSVALSGDGLTAAVGALFQQPNGAVYVFQ